MTPFLLIPKIYPILLATIDVLIAAMPGCVALHHQQVRKTSDDGRMLIRTVSKPLGLNEELRQIDDDEEYDNEWVVEITGELQEAKDIARAVGYKYIAPVRGFDNIYIFSKENHRGKRKADRKSTLALCRHKHVRWAEQQRLHKRFKRDHTDATAAAAVYHTNNINNYNYNNNDNDNIFFDDPFWPQQWNLKNSTTVNGQPISMHVMKAWELGYTGKGVVVTILDDGIQHNHTDIASNYDPQASYDLNDDDPDPMPKFNELNRHGTRCAGEVAMAPNNSFCGVGIAIEAEALSYNIDHIDIFSASWGPMDDGKTVEGPGRLARKAIQTGIQQGRSGKGVIYVWASGNGGMQDDDCGCDGYMDSIYTLSVSSVSEDGTSPWYAEKCAATLTSTFSNGHHEKQMITTTDIGNKCTGTFAGTSASAPMAAAIIALGLDANPSLTWRDVQHIAVWTSNPVPLLNINEGWNRNARGLLVNSRFGFGTKTQLLSVRRRDKSPAGFQHWPFMSVHTWGENPRGIWQLDIEDQSMAKKTMKGIVSNITLILYGTKEEPKHYKK
ncbi:unnamed protein product [Litomosoides sigmodontis]|uniref:P/Homo B domain-containing protein n=1 Tax=Litomosoides sigmodontis TaxID=42156 RepID=A0A3P6UQD6_LITSI|nr:unnamed protein product [Litomosoides sigmodontis]